MRFDWDETKNQTSILKHGIDFLDVLEMFDQPMLTFLDRRVDRTHDGMSSTSKTDWSRLANMEDKDIDTSDIAELDEDFFRNAQLRLPAKKTVTIRLDADVLDWFKGQGAGYQTRINQLLRHYMQAHQD